MSGEVLYFVKSSLDNNKFNQNLKHKFKQIRKQES